MAQSRREFLKSAAAGGIVLVVSRVRLLDSAEAQAAVMDPPGGWKGPPGQARYRIDGLAKVTGKKIYARDFRARDVAGWPDREEHVFVLRAAFADRIFAGVDTDFLPAELRPKRVVTATDLQHDGIGIAKDEYPEGRYLVPEGERPDYLGQPVALLFYDDYYTLQRARSRLLYAPQAIRTAGDATVPPPYDYQPETSILHVVRDGSAPYAVREQFAQTIGGPVRPTEPGKRNADAMQYVDLIGDKLAHAGWDVHQQTYTTQITDPMFMEPESGLAWLDRGSNTLHLLIGSQSPEYDARGAGDLFARPGCAFDVKTVNFTACYPGGGFGGRDTSILCLYLALAAAYAERPIRLAYDRFEQFQVGVKRHAATIDLTVGLDRAGRFQAVRNHTVLNGGGRINVSAYVAQVAAIMGAGAYDFPLADIWSRAQHTRSIVAGSVRAFGSEGPTFAIESMIDEIATQRKMDAIDLRLKNVLRPSWSIVTGAPKAPPGLADICRRAQAHYLWRSRDARRAARTRDGVAYGVGFALAMKNYGTGADGVFQGVALDPSGRIVVTSHAVDMGTGTATTLAVTTARTLGANADEVKTGEIAIFDKLQMVESFDAQPDNPRWTPISFMSHKASTTSGRWVAGVDTASEILFTVGVLPAARALWGTAARGLTAKDTTWRDGKLTARGLAPLPLADIARHAHADAGVVAVLTHAFFSGKWVEADYSVDGVTTRWPVDGLGILRGGAEDYQLIDRANPQLFTVESMWEGNGQTFGAAACLIGVEVATRTGEVTIVEGVQYVAPGRVLVRDFVDGQMDGSFAFGVGYALLEELPPYEDGASDGKWNLNRYHVPLARDCAIHGVEKVVLPPESPDAPARGVAEVTTCPVAPAIANAVAHATGKRFRSLPITPDKVRAALA
jgi:CO/xanthine dehydrogenase Mo-binding subunit